MPYARHLQLATIDFLVGDTAPLTRDQSLLAIAAAMTADGHFDATVNALRYVGANVSDLELVREIIVQTHLFAGYPRALNALKALQDACDKDQVATNKLRKEALEADMGLEELNQRGAAFFDRVYGGNAKRVRDQAQAASPDLAFLSQLVGYGRVLSRPTVDGLTRELCVCSALVLMDVQPQLKGHVQGVLNLGGSADHLWALVGVIRNFFDALPLFDRATRTIESVVGKKPSDLSFEEESKLRWS